MQLAQSIPDLVSKAQFARLTNVDRSRVSQWISERKITADALVGQGREQKVNVKVACAQLNRSLDVGQRTGNGLDTRLNLEQLPKEPDAAAGPSAPPVDSVEEQIKRARLQQIAFANRKAAEEEAARTGSLTDAGRAQQEMGKIAAQMVVLFDSALTEFATALSARFPQIPQRDALHLLRSEFRRIRIAAAASTKSEAGLLPEASPVEIAESAAGQP